MSDVAHHDLAVRVAGTITAVTGRVADEDAVVTLASWLGSVGNRRWALDWLDLADRFLAGSSPTVSAAEEYAFRRIIEAAMGISADDGAIRMEVNQLRLRFRPRR